jgi:hypothetical protein
MNEMIPLRDMRAMHKGAELTYVEGAVRRRTRRAAICMHRTAAMAAMTMVLVAGGMSDAASPPASAMACFANPSVFRPNSVRAQGFITASAGCPRGQQLCFAGRLFRTATAVVASVNVCKASSPGVQAATGIGNVAPSDRPYMSVDRFQLVRVPGA